MKRAGAVAALIGAMLLSTSVSAAGPTVRTVDGALAGTRQPGLNVFLGIPYARPPVGELRWRAPQPVAPWQGVRSATRFAPSCIQGDPVPFGPYTPPFLITPPRSEDCLYLNIWAPSAVRAKRPVYLFIHGGGFQSGGTTVAAYDGAGLARRGAVVVTINYRLGLFGFFAHPELTRESPLGTSGNYGVLDAIEALRWVRANIARFGGDPANVTIAGQSAGSAIVNDMLVSPLAKGLFHRAVLESGPALGIPMQSLAAAEAMGVAGTTKLKVAGIAGLRALSAAALTRAALPVLPLPIADGKVIPRSPEDPAARILSKVPVIAGFNRDESPPAEGPQTVVALEKEIRNRFGALADRFLALYPHRSDAEAARAGAQLAQDRRIAGLLLWAERRAAEAQPAYLYLFEHPFPGSDRVRYGAFHTAEVPYIFGALQLEDASFTAADRRISAQIQQRWLAFMKNGDPGLGWRRASGDPASIWHIGATGETPLLDAERLALFRAFVAQGGKLGLL